MAPWWSSYFLCRSEEFLRFWGERTRAPGARILLIAGAGFDPRATEVCRALSKLGAKLDCRLVRFEEVGESPSRAYLDQAKANSDAMLALIPELQEISIQMRSEGRSVGGRRLSEAFRDGSIFSGYTDVVVDITALPRGLYFPLIGTLLQTWRPPESAAGLPNLHVAICENPSLDARIAEEGGEQVDWMFGFSGGMPLTSQADVPRVWAPVLGAGQRSRLVKYHEFIKPVEICPVLPFPSRDPRRGDTLVLEYQDLLFDSWRVATRDMIFADERNPFDLYRQLWQLETRYAAALSPLGGVRTIVSTHSSKLLSLGVLLAAFERQLAVPNAEPTGYVVHDGLRANDAEGELFSVWLAGEAYRGGAS